MCYDYDTNIIQAIPTKNQNNAEIRDATMLMLTTLPSSGNQLNLHIIENEA